MELLITNKMDQNEFEPMTPQLITKRSTKLPNS